MKQTSWCTFVIIMLILMFGLANKKEQPTDLKTAIKQLKQYQSTVNNKR